MDYQPPPNGWRTFLITWATQAVSVFGTALTLFAMNIWLTQTMYPRPEQRPQLAWALAAVNLAWALPVVFGAPIAGAWADRHDRKRTMIVMDFASGCLTLLLAVLVITETLQVWMLVIVAACAAIFGAFHGAAFDTSYAMLVPEAKLPRANGMMQTIWALSGILSPMLAAALIALPGLARQGALWAPLNRLLAPLASGAGLAMTIDAATFLVAAVALLFLFIPSPTRTDLTGVGGGKPVSLWADVKTGALYIWRRRPLLWLLGTFTLANFAGSPMGVLQPLLVKFNLAPNWSALGLTFETALAALATVASIGGVAGGLIISTWGGLKRRRVYGVIVPLIVAGVTQVVFGLSSWLYLSAAMALLMDAMFPFMNAHSQTIWQTQVPRELQGRVFSVRRLIAQCTYPLGAALAGLLGGLLDPGLIIAALGCLLVIFCIAQLFNPYLLRVEDKTLLDNMAAQAEARPA